MWKGQCTKKIEKLHWIVTIPESETSDFRDTFNVNVLATCIFIREVVKDMQAREAYGHIVVLNSLLGKRVPDVSVPVFGVYPASKFALVGMTEVLRQELNFLKLPIKVTVRLVRWLWTGTKKMMTVLIFSFVAWGHIPSPHFRAFILAWCRRT